MRKGDPMKNSLDVSNWKRRLPVVMIAAIVLGLTGGCACPKAHQAIAIVDVNNQNYSFPDSNRPSDPAPSVGRGAIISFVNTTGKKCTITADANAFEEGHIFTVKAHRCKTATIASSPNPDGTVISLQIDCDSDDHGAPQMIVQGNSG